MAEAVLGLGANLGARRAAFGAAAALLDALPECRALARSRLYETPALGPPQPDYLNAALRVQWSGDALGLLAAAQRLEALLGRERRVRWGPRTLDLDLLHWSEGPVQRAELVVPHPELAQRAFALAPLLDVAPELAPRWAPELARLGGAPPLAEPGWPTYAREGSYLCSGWTRDVSELASQLGDLFAHIARAGRRVRARHTRPFRGPIRPIALHRAALEPDSEDVGGGWLSAAIAAAWRGGFGVRCAVVSAQDEAELSGVLVGEEGVEARAPELPGAHIERRDDGALRVKIAAGAREDGFDFHGSATM